MAQKEQIKGRKEGRKKMVPSKRQVVVATRDDTVQHARNDLTLREYKCVLYAITKIQPGDTYEKAYVFDLRELQELCGLKDESYTELKAIMKGLSDRSWWQKIDPHTESLLRWFSTIRFKDANLGAGGSKVIIKFHEDMMPFLFRLIEQVRDGKYYTQYKLQYILPMSSQYSIRLYDLLKSYQKNNLEWEFPIEELKYSLNCQGYARWQDFRRRVLEPAVAEINKYTDIKVVYEPKKGGASGRKILSVIFYMALKDSEALDAAVLAGNQAMDGQMDIAEFLREVQDKDSQTVKEKLMSEDFWGVQARRAARKKDSLEKDPDGWEYPVTLNDAYRKD